MPPDDKPIEKPTVKMDAVPDWAVKLSTKVEEGFRQTNANIDLVTGDVRSLKTDVNELKAWKLRVESNPTDPPPLTSERVRMVIDAHPSQMDLEQQSKLAEVIIKDEARDKAIAETRELAEKAAAELKKQSDFMGIGKKGLAWLRSKDARGDIMAAVTLIGIAYTALKAAGVIK